MTRSNLLRIDNPCEVLGHCIVIRRDEKTGWWNVSCLCGYKTVIHPGVRIGQSARFSTIRETC
jgi:hypothetical protein